MQSSRTDDQQLEQVIGNLLRAGVSAAAAVVLIGAIVYLAQNQGRLPDYTVFHPAPAAARSIGAVFQGALRFEGQALIQCGLVLLLATPLARVILAVFAFAIQRDWRYTLVTLLVLAILCYSLIHGYVESTVGR